MALNLSYSDNDVAFTGTKTLRNRWKPKPFSCKQQSEPRNFTCPVKYFLDPFASRIQFNRKSSSNVQYTHWSKTCGHLYIPVMVENAASYSFYVTLLLYQHSLLNTLFILLNILHPSLYYSKYCNLEFILLR